MTQTSNKRRNIIIASLIVVVLLISAIAAYAVFHQPTAGQTPTELFLTISMNQTEVIQGSNSQIQVYVTSIGKAENVTLSSNVNSSGVNYTFEPAFGESNFTSTLTYTVSESTPTGEYPVDIIASSDGQTVNVSSVLSVLSNVGAITVSGKVGSNALSQPFLSSLIGIQFTDTQTGTETSFYFHFPPPPSLNPFGTYSVILMNKHTYNVTISYYIGPSANNMIQKVDYVGDFTVQAPAGENAISKNFA
jgi:methionine-rich copper-binding protein CopC